MATTSHCCIHAAKLSTSLSSPVSKKSSSLEVRALYTTPLASFQTLKSSLFSETESFATLLNNNGLLSKVSCNSRPNTISRKAAKSVTMASAGDESLPVLNEMPLVNYINQQGYISPPVEPGTAATVFAVFDMNKKIQYVGFSKDVRNSLRTLMGRRPEMCYYYKLHNLKTLDQQQMITIRQQWFSEVGLPPVGNSDPIQRNYWEKPTDAGSISERGKAAAALSKSKTLLQMMVDRGLKEEMVYDPALIEKGKCDVLSNTSQASDASLASALAEAENAPKKKQVKIEAPSGELVEFEFFFENKYVTNGGWMYDVLVTKDDKETRHRVVVGKIYTQVSGMSENEFVERLFAFLLYLKTPRRTEGVLAITQFAVNYFSVSEVAQKFEGFNDWFGNDMPDSYWRFNRIHSYGNKTSPAADNVNTLPAELTFPKY